MTDSWKKSGVDKGYHYKHLTNKEYESLGFEKGIKKEKMTKMEILTLSALESMEALKLEIKPLDGYYECKNSIEDTAKEVLKLSEKKRIK